MDEFSDLMTWPRDRDRLRQEILKSESWLKIVLKTKDEVELLDPWLRWHIEICGAENIIVFDHGSTLPQIADIYRAHPDIKVCRYQGHLDVVHYRPSFDALYRALEESSRYYAVIDTDEMVTLALNSGVHDRHKLISFLAENSDVDVFPGISLNNRPGSRERVYLNSWNGQICGPGLLWGKPFVKSGTDLGCQTWLHNSWIRNINQNSFCNNVIILHFNQLSFERQKRVSLSKFISKGRVPPETTVAQISFDESLGEGKSDETKQLLSEFRRFVRTGDLSWQVSEESIPAGMAEFSSAGSIIHSSSEQADRFQELLDDRRIFPRVVAAWREQNRGGA